MGTTLDPVGEEESKEGSRKRPQGDDAGGQQEGTRHRGGNDRDPEGDAAQPGGDDAHDEEEGVRPKVRRGPAQPTLFERLTRLVHPHSVSQLVHGVRVRPLPWHPKQNDHDAV